MKKLSVIMPSLNVADYIREAVESVIRQTLSDIEIICVDAGSTDGTREIIEELAGKDQRIMVVISPVRSYGFQVNMGLDRASGEYIAILETDDHVDKDMYRELCELADRAEADYVKCDYCTYYTGENGERVYTKRKISGNKSLYEESFVPGDHAETATEDWYLWNGVYRTEFLKRNGISFSETKGAAFQDIGFLHKTTAAAGNARYLDRPLYMYCVGRGEASSKSDKTLEFVRNEYGMLINGMEDSASQNELRLLYRRMAKSFVRACQDSSDEALSEESNKQRCVDLWKWLKDAEEDGYVSADALPDGMRKDYIRLMDDPGAFSEYRKEKRRELSDFLAEGKDIVIFGCGDIGRNAYFYLTREGYKISGFMDNNPSLWGKDTMGVTVYAPAEVKTFSPDTSYVIANEKYAEDIRKQLEELMPGVRMYKYSPL